MTKTKKKNLYQVFIREVDDGIFKFCHVKKHEIINQHKKTWKTVNSRKIARLINKSKLVIK